MGVQLSLVHRFADKRTAHLFHCLQELALRWVALAHGLIERLHKASRTRFKGVILLAKLHCKCQDNRIVLASRRRFQ